MQLFGITGQKFLHCHGTKGQRDKLKILPRDEMGRDSQKVVTGQDGTAKILDRTRDRAENDVLKQENDVLKKEIWSSSA